MSDFSSSDDSEMSEYSNSSDTDVEAALEERVRPKNENFFDVTVPQFNRAEFMDHFRVSRDVANALADRFAVSTYFKEKTGPYRKLTPLQHTLIFLWYAGHQTSSFRDVADRFNITVSSLHRVIHRMTYFLSNLSPEIITWPNRVEKQEIEQYFRNKYGFPDTIGLIDGTHIKIDKPEDDPDSYINRKGFYSLQVQLVCDHKLRIRDFFAGYPGSVHDARVFRTSPLFQSIEEKCQDYHLLGDSAYPLLVNLLTPYTDRGILTQQQQMYNIKHSQIRIKIEHCNGLLKQKWRQLYHVKQRDVRKITHFIRACCVLHNLAINEKFPLEVENNQIERDPEFVNDEQEVNATQKRNHIVNILR